MQTTYSITGKKFIRRINAILAILQGYIEPRTSGNPKFFKQNDEFLQKVKEVLEDSEITTIDDLVSAIVKGTDEIEKKDASLYRRLQYICALGDKPLEAYSNANASVDSVVTLDYRS